ncbi:MAG: DUF4159 domain-containing protein [Polyangiaceae bacterium]|jgi:hypothetical protein
MTSIERVHRTGALALVVGSLLALVWIPRPARAFGDAGAFDPRALLTGSATEPPHPSALARWSWELVQRTSAPARLHPTSVRADDPEIVNGPFLYWSGDADVPPLTGSEMAGLRQFLSLGGLLFVDDAGAGPRGEPSGFGRAARRELARVLPERTAVTLGREHVLFRTFYLLQRALGRVEGPPTLEAIVRGTDTQVLLSEHDLGGALARGPEGASWERQPIPGGEAQREQAIRFAINVSMYALCSTYKDDQVHAPFLMRRRARLFP